MGKICPIKKELSDSLKSPHKPHFTKDRSSEPLSYLCCNFSIWQNIPMIIYNLFWIIKKTLTETRLPSKHQNHKYILSYWVEAGWKTCSIIFFTFSNISYCPIAHSFLGNFAIGGFTRALEVVPKREGDCERDKRQNKLHFNDILMICTDFLWGRGGGGINHFLSGTKQSACYKSYDFTW